MGKLGPILWGVARCRSIVPSLSHRCQWLQTRAGAPDWSRSNSTKGTSSRSYQIHPRLIMAQPFMTADTFDPRTEMGYIQLPYLGLYRGSIPIAGQVPSGVFSDKERWRPIEIPFDYFQCWDVRIGLNGRHLENIMSRDSMLASIGDRITHWKGYGKMLPPDRHRGLVWLGPWPQEWSELRSFMNCRVSWLIYQGWASPCPAALRVRSPSRTPRLRWAVRDRRDGKRLVLDHAPLGNCAA